MSLPIRVRCVDDLTDRIEFVHQRITQRAHEQWLSVRALRPPLSVSWSAAERDLLFEPATGIREWGHGIIVEMNCSDVDPVNIRLFMSAHELLVLAPLNKRGGDRWLFRHLRFETELDGVDATAEYENSILRIFATKLNAPDDEKMRFCIA